MQIDIKCRFTGCVLFSHSAEGNTIRETVEAAVSARANLTHANLTGADLARAYLAGANLAGANLTGADLARAYLARAYLAGANLVGANFAGANFAGAKWADNITLTRAPLQIHGLHYFVTILDAHMQIGCKLHTLAEWEAFDDASIVAMDGKDALTFWRAHKGALLAMAKSDGRGAK